jgi:hypothetical protein
LIQVPTLVLHRAGDADGAQASDYLAAHIRTASRVALPGSDYFLVDDPAPTRSCASLGGRYLCSPVEQSR